MFGVGLVVAIFAILAWRKRRYRDASGERPPQRAKLLRPAGYSLHCRIDQLNEKLSYTLMQAVLAGAVVGLVCGGLYPVIEGLILREVTFGQLRAHPQSYLFLSLAGLLLAGLAWMIANVARSLELLSKLRNYQFGLRGEQAVAEALSAHAVAAAGFTIFHDIPGDGPWNIDHILVGPAGILVLETKARSRRKPTGDQPDHEVCFDGQCLQFPWCEDRAAVKQVQRNMDWVRQFVAGFGPNNITIQAIIVVPGWFVRSQGNFSVKAMNATYLVKHLSKCKRQYSSEELQAIIRRLEERCRDLEF